MFTPDSVRAVTPKAPPFRVFRQARPPQVNGDPKWPYWPATDVFTQPQPGWGQTQIGVWEEPWIPRWRGGWDKKPNYVGPPHIIASDGLPCQVEYTSVPLSIGAAAGRLARSCGYLPRGEPSDPRHEGWLDKLQRLGFDTSGLDNASPQILQEDMEVPTGDAIITHAYATANADSVFPINKDGKRLVQDKVFLNPYRLADVVNRVGILADLESDDDPGELWLTRRVAELSLIAKAKRFKFGILTDPLTAAGSHLNLTSNNITQVMGRCDYINFCPTPAQNTLGYAGLESGFQLYAKWPQRVLLQLSVGTPTMNIDVARMYNQFAKDKHLGGVIIVPDYANTAVLGPRQIIAACLGLSIPTE